MFLWLIFVFKKKRFPEKVNGAFKIKVRKMKHNWCGEQEARNYSNCTSAEIFKRVTFCWYVDENVNGFDQQNCYDSVNLALNRVCRKIRCFHGNEM